MVRLTGLSSTNTDNNDKTNLMTTTNPHTSNPTSRDRSPLPRSLSVFNNNHKMDTHLPTLMDTPSVLSNQINPFSQTPLQSPSYGGIYLLGTRKSSLALIQTELVAAALRSHHPSKEYSFPIESMSTLGDRNQSTPLHQLSPYNSNLPAKSLWTDELEARLIRGQMDFLVHSCKDVPTVLKDGCEIGCMPRREDPRDAFVVREGLEFRSLGELPPGSVVGTGSVRRVAQLKRAYPHLLFEDMRGNLNTRLAKLDSPTSKFSALILATAGLSRLNLSHRITSPLEAPTLYHAVGQGALAIEIRSGDIRARETLRGIGHWETEWVVACERGCLRVLEGGCSVPVGVTSSLVPLDPTSPEYDAAAGWIEEELSPLDGKSPMLHFSGILPDEIPFPTPNDSSMEVSKILQRRKAKITLNATVTSLDGSKHVVYSPEGIVVSSWRGAEAWGEECARQLRSLGAAEILDEIVGERKRKEERERQEALAAQNAEMQQ